MAYIRELYDLEKICLAIIVQRGDGDLYDNCVIKIKDDVFCEILRAVRQASDIGDIRKFRSFYVVHEQDEKDILGMDVSGYQSETVFESLLVLYAKNTIHRIVEQNILGDIERGAELRLQKLEDSLLECLQCVRSMERVMSEDVDFVNFDLYMDQYQKEESLYGKYVVGDYHFDERCVGLAPQEISILFGVTGVGKSMFATYLANCLASVGVRVLYFNLEMKQDVLFDRLIRQVLCVNKVDIVGKNRVEILEAYRSIHEKVKHLNNIEMYTKHSSVTLEELRIKVEDYRKKYVGERIVVVIDLLSMITGFGVYASEVEASMNILHELVMRTDVHLLGILQANREAESKGATKENIRDMSRMPSLSMVKNSNAPAERSRLVLAVHREPLKDTYATSNYLRLKGYVGADKYTERFYVSACKFTGGESFSCSYLADMKDAMFIPVSNTLVR